MLTATQVCKRLGISRDTLRKLVNDGRITAIRVGGSPVGHLRFSEQSVNDYIKRQTVTVPTESDTA